MENRQLHREDSQEDNRNWQSRQDEEEDADGDEIEIEDDEEHDDTINDDI